MIKKFIILSSQRSWSTLLFNWLSKIKNIECKKIDFNLPDNFQECLKKIRKKFKKKSDEIMYVWIKWQINQNQEVFNYLYTIKNIYLIVLYRKNLFKQYLSWVLADKSWNFENNKNDSLIEINTNWFIKYIETQKKLFIHHLKKFKTQKKLFISYEQLDLYYDKAFKQILDFIWYEVNNQNFEKQTIKQEFMKPSQRILSFELIKNQFKNTKYENFFIDELSSIYDINLEDYLLNFKND